MHTLYQIKEEPYIENVKIGITKGPAIERIRGLQTGNPRPLYVFREELFFNEKDARTIERTLHFIFNPNRLHGEWYRIPVQIQNELFASCDVRDLIIFCDEFLSLCELDGIMIERQQHIAKMVDNDKYCGGGLVVYNKRRKIKRIIATYF